MEQGVVKFFNSKKGFGFIKPDAGGRDVFVHHTGIKQAGFRELFDGDKVEFTREKGPKGEQAGNVRKLK